MFCCLVPVQPLNLGSCHTHADPRGFDSWLTPYISASQSEGIIAQTNLNPLGPPPVHSPLGIFQRCDVIGNYLFGDTVDGVTYDVT